jgi:zinc D-Ala-D-Ala carboxypeptidase
MKISPHLNLAELTRSETAKRNGIDNTPTAEHLENFKLLADKVFEPIREHFKTPIFISSGYRSKELNELIKGSATSQHCKGSSN